MRCDRLNRLSKIKQPPIQRSRARAVEQPNHSPFGVAATTKRPRQLDDFENGRTTTTRHTPPGSELGWCSALKFHLLWRGRAGGIRPRTKRRSGTHSLHKGPREPAPRPLGSGTAIFPTDSTGQDAWLWRHLRPEKRNCLCSSLRFLQTWCHYWWLSAEVTGVVRRASRCVGLCGVSVLQSLQRLFGCYAKTIECRAQGSSSTRDGRVFVQQIAGKRAFVARDHATVTNRT